LIIDIEGGGGGGESEVGTSRGSSEREGAGSEG